MFNNLKFTTLLMTNKKKNFFEFILLVYFRIRIYILCFILDFINFVVNYHKTQKVSIDYLSSKKKKKKIVKE